MALLSEHMGFTTFDSAWNMAVQRISGGRKEKEGAGISKAISGDDTVSVSST